MSVLLVDLHDDGHHLEFASNLLGGLSDTFPDRTIDFLMPSQRKIHKQYFAPGEVTYMYDHDVSARLKVNSIRDNISRVLNKPRNELVRNVTSYTDGYDIVHFLHADDILGELNSHGTSIDAIVFANLIGGFFQQTKFRAQVANRIISTGFDDVVAAGIPDILSRRSPWDLLDLSRALQHNAIDDVFLNSEPGRQLVRSALQVENVKLPPIPDPVPAWFEKDVSRTNARQALGLPADEFVLTYFGEIRAEKGVDILLDALKRYKGPALTCVIAGNPKYLDPSDIVVENERISLQSALEYIPQEDVRTYYSAADCVVLPYRQSFGEYRRSGTFQKACTAGRPVIAPAFGQFADLTVKHNLGVTFEPGSADDLAKVIEQAVKANAKIYDEKQMREYAQHHTYTKLVDITASLYREYL